MSGILQGGFFLIYVQESKFQKNMYYRQTHDSQLYFTEIHNHST